MSEENNRKSEEETTDIKKEELQKESMETQPPTPVEEVKPVKKKHKWVWIGLCGIALPLLIVIGTVVGIFLLLAGAFTTCVQNCASSICQGCCQSCEDSCNNACGQCYANACNSCCDNCGESCSNSCQCSGCNCSSSKIILSEKSSNIINLLKWIYYILFGIFK